MRLIGLRRSQSGQSGQGAIEYLGLVLVVVAIVGALVATGIGAELSEKIGAQVCQIAGGGNCGGDSGSGSQAQGGDQGKPGDGLPAADDGTPKTQTQIDYDKALKALKDAQALEKSDSEKALEAAKELGKILADELGITDALDCVTKGDMGACTETLINVLLSLVGGAVGKLAAKYGAPWKWKKAYELIKKLKKHGGDLYDGLKGLLKNRKKVKEAEQKLAGARKKLDAEKKNPPKKNEKPDDRPTVCPARHSFVPGTPVLLADGRRTAIEKVDVGDRVFATDPYTGRTGVREVEQVITTHDDKDFTRLTFSTATGPAVITTTDTHPFWLADQGRWAEAGDIEPGAKLRAADGAALAVASVSRYTRRQTTHDLTVSGIHTYYVVADRTGLLVHNNDGPAGIPAVDNARLQKIVDALYHGVGNAELVGDGSAMAAASAEVNGVPGVEGRNHVGSTAQLRASLQNFLTKDVIRLKGGKKETVIRSPKDIKIARILIQAIDDAQLGKYKGHKNYPGLDEC